MELFLDIEDKWNKGKFGEEYENCDDFLERKNWDKNTGLGRQKIFEVRSIYNDLGFIDAFLTEDFCRENKFFTYSYDKKSRSYVINSRDFKEIKRQFIFKLTNLGNPIISLKDANHENRGEMMLVHNHNGTSLKKDYAEDTLRNMVKIWKKPVNLETINPEGKKIFVNCDGKEIKIREI